eukprot:352989-Chlamydomonas_euryale.AAC.1
MDGRIHDLSRCAYKACAHSWLVSLDGLYVCMCACMRACECARARADVQAHHRRPQVCRAGLVDADGGDVV